MTRMESIYEEGLKESIRTECENNAGSYSVESSGNGCLPTEDTCSQIAYWIASDWDNFLPVYDSTKETLEEAKGNFEEYADICISEFYKDLEIENGECQEIGDSETFMFQEVKRLLKENYNL